MNDAALLSSRVQEANARFQPITAASQETNSAACPQQATPNDRGDLQGLAHGFMDSVIDLLEVIEMDMHHKGERRLAIYAKTLRGTYLARRINQRS